jgi:molybdopterin synthase catalytic subunit
VVMTTPLMAVTAEALAVEALTAALEADVRHRGEGCGALCSFVGVVRATHQRQVVRYLEYEAHVALAMRAFAIIADEVAGHWPLSAIAIHHRIGRLAIGQPSVVVVGAAAHRAEAFRVCRYGIERVKQIAPVWKHEFYEGGQSWLEGPTADPADETLKRAALEQACA